MWKDFTLPDRWKRVIPKVRRHHEEDYRTGLFSHCNRHADHADCPQSADWHGHHRFIAVFRISLHLRRLRAEESSRRGRLFLRRVSGAEVLSCPGKFGAVWIGGNGQRQKEQPKSSALFNRNRYQNFMSSWRTGRHCRLCPLHVARSQAAGADMHSLRTTVYLAFHSLDISFPHCIGLSIGMAYIVTKKDALAANITLSHFATSSAPACPYACILLWQQKIRQPYFLLYTTLIYYQKYMEKASKKNFF